jgi:hypothetical protein
LENSMRGGSTAVTIGLLNRRGLSLILCTVVENLKQIIKIALESFPDSASVEIAELILTEKRALIRDWLVAQIERQRKPRTWTTPRRNGRRREPDPRQTWLPLPEYPHIPVDAQADSLEEYRQRIIDTEAKAKSYANRSSKKEILYKRQLSEMKRLERKVAPFFANDPSMTVGRAVILLRESLSPAARAHQKEAARAREAAKRAGKART